VKRIDTIHSPNPADPSGRIALSHRVGLLSTWNQECGLATYARYLFSKFSGDNVIVLSEKGAEIVRADEPFVYRCWERSLNGHRTAKYDDLLKVILDQRIEILHINTHAYFFSYPEFSEFLNVVRSHGIVVLAQIHNTFTLEESLRQYVTHVDALVVHTSENRLEAVANGAKAESVFVIPHGVEEFSFANQSKEEIRSSLHLPREKKLVTSFGFIQPHKGVEAVLEAVHHLKSKKIPAAGIIVGSTREDDPNSTQYLSQLRQLVQQHNLSADIHFISRYVDDAEVAKYLFASDVVVMNYRSQHFEASGACSLAVGAGVPTMTSLAPAMMSFGDAVWHLTSGFPPGLSAELLLTDEKLQNLLRNNARKYAAENAWPQVAIKIINIYQELTTSRTAQGQENNVNRKSNFEKRKGDMRVLIQNRPQTFTLRGGDTVVIEKLQSGLTQRGVEVVVDVDGRENAADYDLVHIFNFATPDITKVFAERAKTAGTPYVVTTLCEDLPLFHYQSHIIANKLAEYVEREQDQVWWKEQRNLFANLPVAPSFNNAWVAENAAALLCNGDAEARVLKRDYPTVRSIVNVPLGHEVGSIGNAERFIQQYGVSDFVFCVGRFESRKNQLMLLKALENSELTVVLASGGFSYQPEYDRAVRNFKRKGKTIVLDRLDPGMLASAYAACKIHVLASWYELPGLVSLEAAAYNKNVVVTRNGTAEDYFKEKAFYCDPASEESIRNAVVAAYYSPIQDGVKELAASYSWSRMVDETIDVYAKVSGKAISAPIQSPVASGISEHVASAKASAPPTELFDYAENATEFQDLLEKGEIAAKNVDFEEAHEFLSKAETLNPNSVRMLKARGAVLLAESKVREAKEYFDRALKITESDPKVLAGRGMCAMMERSVGTAMPYFLKALEIQPDHLVALHQMVECSYSLNTFSELHKVLVRYLSGKPEDSEMRYCFAGCLYKEGQLEHAIEQLDTLLEYRPNHESGRELKEKILGEMKGYSSEEISSKPKSVSAGTQQSPKPIVSGTGISESLLDLSRMVTEWKVDTSTKAPVATSHPTTIVEQPLAIPTERVPTVGASRIEATAAPVVPIATTGGTDVIFMEVEDLKRERKFEEASRQLEGILSRSGLSPEQQARAQSTKADILAITGDLVGADMLYDIILREYHDFPRALCGKGALAAEDQRWDEARSYFEKAKALDPKYDVPLAGIAICEMSENRAEEAFALFKEAIRLNPENHRAIVGIIQLGYPLREYGTIEAAINAFLELHPVNIDMMYSLAGVYFAQDRLTDARAEVEKILLFEPQNPRAVELRGMIEQKSSGLEVGQYSAH